MCRGPPKARFRCLAGNQSGTMGLKNYANAYVTSQSHELCAGEQTHYATANEVKSHNILFQWVIFLFWDIHFNKMERGPKFVNE